ncbi:MAG: type II toxin-antitoxin system VapC family toxin [Gemmatimonadota bacterium]|nr:type II toxin-antitoxin system VapC family toxin [Gemmatimonadota bacterium]
MNGHGRGRIKYIIDTNLYIEATRNDEAAEALKAFYQRNLPHVFLHSVVAQELLAGASRPDSHQAVLKNLIEPFEAVRRIITPDHGEWKRAGEIRASLVRRKEISPRGCPPSFLNDCLIAASARNHGIVIITRNLSDFRLISLVHPTAVLAPWPV